MTPIRALTLNLLAGCLLAPAASAAPLTALQLAEPPSSHLSIGVAGDRFGRKVALDGDIAAILAPDQSIGVPRSGVAYVSRRVAGSWTAPQPIAIPNPDGRNQYAQSLALSGDTLVVGSYERNGNTGLPGRVDVFVRAGNDFVHQATLSTPDASIAFAVSVAIDGDDLVVGDQITERVTVYRRTAGVWAQTHQLLPPDAVTGTNFSVSLAIEGDLVAVGRPYFPSFEQRSGAVLLYRRPAPAASFAFEHGYTMEGGGFMPELGFAQIDIDDGRVIAGAAGYRLGGDAISPPGRGAVVVLERDAGNWTRTLLFPSDPGNLFDFGLGVALDGARALVGALDGATGRGKLYAFARGATQWVENQRVLVGPGGDTPVMGIAISGSQALVGIPSFQVPTVPGNAYVYSTGDLPVPDAAIALDRGSAPACLAPAVVAASWTSDGAHCRTVAQGSMTNTRWIEASCADPDGSCPDPLDYRRLEGSGQARFTASTDSLNAPPGSVVAIECSDSSGPGVRASAAFRVNPAGGSCALPDHTVSATLSQGPTALPDGSFEMRAAISNPGGQTLSAMARHGQFGTTHARVIGNELVLRYAPDYATVGTQSLLSDSIGAAVDNGQHAVETGYSFQVPLHVYSNGFE